MSEFRNRPDKIRGPKKPFWHFDGRATDWHLDVREGGGRAELRRDSDLDNGKLRHYMRVGAIHSDIEAEENEADRVDRKDTVVKWLVAMLLFWIVFSFVQL